MNVYIFYLKRIRYLKIYCKVKYYYNILCTSGIRYSKIISFVYSIIRAINNNITFVALYECHVFNFVFRTLQ